MSSKKTLCVKYENLLQEYDEEVEKLCNFLSIDCSDASIKEILLTYKPGRMAPDQPGTHIWKGKIGRHREHFTSAQLERCQDLFGGFLSRNNYLS